VEKGEDLDCGSIEAKLAQLTQKIKDVTKLKPDMTPEEMQQLPDKLDKAIKEKEEYDIRLKIIAKLDTKK